MFVLNSGWGEELFLLRSEDDEWGIVLEFVFLLTVPTRDSLRPDIISAWINKWSISSSSSYNFPARPTRSKLPTKKATSMAD